MKNLSKEGLVEHCCSGYGDHHMPLGDGSYGQPRQIILSRLNRLDEVEKENKELKESIRHWEGSRDGVLQSMTEQEHKYLLVCENYVTLQKENAELRTQVENKKCCGNCRINCNCESFFRGWHKYCDQWQADSMTREEREK